MIRTKPAARTRVVAYARVSTEKQADLGASLAAQEDKLRAYAELCPTAAALKSAQLVLIGYRAGVRGVS